MNMAVFSQQFYFFYTVLLISIMSSLFLMMNLVYAGRPTGFSLELIHSDFLESKNLSQLERMERAYQQMNALDRRQQQLTAAASSSMNSSWVSNNNTTGGSKYVETYFFDHYLVKIAIGSFDNGGGRVGSTLYYLNFDTASDLLWLQCLGGEKLLPQYYAYFPWQSSITFKYVPCDDHNLCPTGECYDKVNFRPCKYDIEYADDSDTTGFLAKDTLIFSPGPSGKFVNFIFGCGMSQKGFQMGQRAAGVMGFAGGRASFVSQLGVTKFEYCLLPSWTPSTDLGPSTFLRFNSQTIIGAGGQAVQTTPMYIGTGTVYYVTMIGISVGGTQIRYDNDELTLKSDGTGGCVFDTANPYSTLSTAVFRPLQAYLLHYYRNLTPRPPPPDTLYEICFVIPIGFKDFPEIIFHFRGGAVFHIEKKAAFAVYNDFFCFNLVHRDDSDISVVVGGIIQGNHRVLYDIGQQQLSWALEDCAANR